MPVKVIDRIALPDAETFFRKYVYTRTPVILSNLFAGAPIREITSLEEARRAFGSVTLSVRPEYVSAAAGGSGQDSARTMTFNEYWDCVHSQPDSALLCTEYEIPARIMALFELPALCRSRDAGSQEILELPRKYGDHDLWENVFIAGRGNKAHLHYDGDHRQVLLYQVFGTKEVILFPPGGGLHLKPLEAGPGFSGIFFEHLSTSEKSELLDRGGGYCAILHPGEAVYIPMLMWHYLGYEEDAMSFNIRFGRNRYGRFLCLDNFHRDYYLQNFAAQLADADGLGSAYREAVEEISAEYVLQAPDREQKVRRMRALFQRLCTELCPDARVELYCPAEREESEVGKILKDIANKTPYARPEALAARILGAATSTQKGLLAEEAARNGYTAQVLRQLLLNRTGKPEIDLLTKVEAAQFMRYMRSPGACW